MLSEVLDELPVGDVRDHDQVTSVSLSKRRKVDRVTQSPVPDTIVFCAEVESWNGLNAEGFSEESFDKAVAMAMTNFKEKLQEQF